MAKIAPGRTGGDPDWLIDWFYLVEDSIRKHIVKR